MAQEVARSTEGLLRAEQIVAANQELVEFIESCGDGEWKSLCTAESWPVNVVAHHIAWGHSVSANWIRTIRLGIDVPGSPEAHDKGNQAMAASVADITRDEVIRLALQNVSELADLLRSLTADDFEKRSAFGPAGGMPMSIDQLAGARRHLDRHLSSMRAAIES